jgi:hypothetical protein
LPATSISQAQEMAAVSRGGMVDDDIPYESITSIPQKTLIYIPDYPVPTRKTYYQTVQLLKISWPDWRRHDQDVFASKLIVGLNKPLYRLKKDIRVLGSFDLKLENIILGFFNSANVTLKYDLKKLHRDERSEIKILVEKVTFKIGIPF